MTVSLVARALSLVLLIVVGTGCTAEPPMLTADTTPAPASAAASPAPAVQSSTETAVARLGTIAETVPLAGRVGLLDEVNVMPSTASRVTRVLVSPKDVVTEGQTLLEADTSGIERELANARSRLATGQQRIEKAQAALQARARRAAEDLERLRGSASAADRLSAESAIAVANSNLQRAEAELARLVAPPSAADLGAANDEITTATLAVRKAEADREKLAAGPDPSELRKLETDVATAEGAMVKAEAAYRQLVRGPDVFEVRAAERQVEEAQDNLRVAQATQLVPRAASASQSRADRQAAQRELQNAQLQREVNIRKAELALESAQDRLLKLSQGPSRADVDASIRAVDLARRAYDDARQRIELARAGASPSAVAAADAAVVSARSALARAESRLAALQAGPPSEQVRAAQSSVTGARAAVDASVARLADLNNQQRIQSLAVQDAEERLNTLQAVIAGSDSSVTDVTTADQDVAEFVLARRALQQERDQIAALERDQASARIVSPVAGIVSAILVGFGDPIEPNKPAIVVARPSDLVIRATVPPQSQSRLAAGLPATVRVDGMAGGPFGARLRQFDDAGGARTAVFDVNWPPTQPELGTGSQVFVILEQKDRVVIVPQRAIREVGPRKFVDVLEGGTTRRVEITSGVSSGGEVEVVSGLREGQVVAIQP